MKRKIRVRDPKQHVLQVRLGERENAQLRYLARRLTRGNRSEAVRIAIRDLFKGVREKNALQWREEEGRRGH